VTILSKLKNKLIGALGGRPMTFEANMFYDHICGKKVNSYIDIYNRRWLATNRWGFFRVMSSFQSGDANGK